MSEGRSIGSIENNEIWPEGRPISNAAGGRAAAGVAGDKLAANIAEEKPAKNAAEEKFASGPAGEKPAVNTAASKLTAGSMGNLTAGPNGETEYTRNLKAQAGPLGLWSFLYACFYAFCMFRNPSGVTYPFFIAGSLLFFCSALSKLGISWKKGSGFYVTGILLLALSTFCTDDGRIIWMNKAGILLLLISLLLNQVYDTSRWKLGKYLGSIFRTLFLSIGQLARPFQDLTGYYREKGKGKGGKFLLAAAALGLSMPLFVVVFLLLASADVLFREMSNRILSWINLPNLVSICLMVVFMFLAAYCLLSYLCKKAISEEVKEHGTGEPVLAITVLTVLTILYLMFSGIQILGLFLGKMRLPEGYTYAGYAREGFFQLLAVSVLNLILVLAALTYFRESKVLKGVLTVMSACTFIMIASSALRMIMYIRYYYLTFLRVFVLWSLVLLFLLFAGVVIGIFRKDFPLFRYGCVTVTCCYLLLSFAHPDYWIARVNLLNAGECGDYNYLYSLSADAAPVILPFLERQVDDRSGQIGQTERPEQGVRIGQEEQTGQGEYLDQTERPGQEGQIDQTERPGRGEQIGQTEPPGRGELLDQMEQSDQVYLTGRARLLGREEARYVDRLLAKQEAAGVRNFNVSRQIAFHYLKALLEKTG